MLSKTIAIVINTSWNIYNFRLGLLNALKEDGYKVVCIAPNDSYSKKLEALGFEYHDIQINNMGTNPIEDLKLIVSLYSLYKKVSPDIILHYTIKPNIYGSIAANMLNIPTISNISGLGTVFLNKKVSSRIAQFLYKVALKVPKRVFFQNRDDQELFIKLGLVDQTKTDLLPGSGIDTKKFKPLEIEKEDESVVKFLFIGRLVKDKGIEEYVDAAKILNTKEYESSQKSEFHILGAYYPGNPTAITEDEMQFWEEEGYVKYIGTSDDVRSVIAQYDCIVLPSYREGLSRVLLEAASMAKPLIATDVPGCRDVVEDGVNGYLCRVKDSQSLAEQMGKMLGLSYQKREVFGHYGREKVIQEFDEMIVIEKYKSAIRELEA